MVTPKKAPKKSKTTLMREFRARVHRLHVIDEFRPVEVFDILVTEGAIDGKNRPAALRRIERACQAALDEADPKTIRERDRDIETTRYAERLLRRIRKLNAEIDDDSMIPREVMSPSGMVVSIMVPKFSEQDKARKEKLAAQLEEKRAIVLGVDVKRKDDAKRDGDDPSKNAPSEPFEIVVKGAEFSDLVALNLESGKVN